MTMTKMMTHTVTSSLMKRLGSLDYSIITLYEVFDYPADQILADPLALATFSRAVDQHSRIGLYGVGPAEYQLIIARRLLRLRKASAKMRREGFRALALLGRKWEGPKTQSLWDFVKGKGNFGYVH